MATYKVGYDWASRPYGENSFARKPSVVTGASPGAIGTAVAQQHLRSLLGYSNSPQMNVPKPWTEFRPGLIDVDGHVSESTEQFLCSYRAEFYFYVFA